MRRILWTVFLLGIAPFNECLSQSPSTLPAAVQVAADQKTPSPDAEAIRATANAFVAAFNKRDAKAVAAFWTKDGEFVDDSGRTFAGRDAIEALYTENFAAQPESKLQIIVDAVRLLSNSAAIEDGQAVVEPVAGGAAVLGHYTAVHVKVDGKWLMASVRETRSDPLPAANDVADLEWLIGDWTAEENGAHTESKCRWLINKKFVERSYTTTQANGTASSGLQILGWNPQSNSMQSWNFSADGGHAIGVLSAIEGGWMAEISGTTGAGVPTTAINTLKRLDDNAYAWQSTARTLDGAPLPDTDEVVIRRKSAPR